MKENTIFPLDGRATLTRRAKILEILEKQGHVRINELKDNFNVSEVTLRNDLEKLEEKKLLIRTRGGGIQTPKVMFDYQFNKELTISLKEKQAIGKEAAKLVNDNETIILDSGTTTLEVARNLIHLNNVTIITNGINIAYELLNYPNLKIIMIGGSIRQSTLSLIGPIAEDNLRNLYCDKVFLGVNGVDSKLGLFTSLIEDTALNRIMIKMSKEVIVVTDSTKFFKKSFSIVAPINSVDILVTDSNIPKDELQNLNNAGVRTILVESSN